MIVSPHTLIESPVSGSTPESFVDQAKALGRKYIAYTDPCTMTALHRVYEYAKKKELKTIAGLKIYFSDSTCELTKDFKSKYLTLTLYASNQENFQKLSRLASKPRPVVESYGMECPLWNWADLKEASEIGLYAVSTDIHDMVTKGMLIGKAYVAEPMMLKLKELFQDRYSVAINGTRITHSWLNVTSINKNQLSILGDAKVMVSYAGKNDTKTVKLKAQDINQSKHIELIYYILNGRIMRVNQKINQVTHESGFVRICDDDLQYRANRLLVLLAKRHGVKILYTDHACYAKPEDKFVQDVRLLQDGHREHAKRHMQTKEEALEYLAELGFGEEILENNAEWASGLEFAPQYDYQLPSGGEDALTKLVQIIRQKNRLPDDQRYLDQLKHEIRVLGKNGTIDLLPYFLPIVDVVEHYRDNGFLTSVGRGSAAGSLLAYLIGITEVDPIRFGLSFERFISLDRVQAKTMPDIDTDLPSRDLLVGEDGKSGYLFKKYGDRAAQISTRTLLRLKSAIKDVHRALHGSVSKEIEAITKALPSAPQGISDEEFVFGYKDAEGGTVQGLIDINDDFKRYIERFPNEWAIVKRSLSISRTFSRHASAFVISDRPISDTTPVFMGNVTQYDAKYVEKTGLIKYDFLVVNQLQDIQNCLRLINKKNNAQNEVGWFDHQGQKVYIWNLPEDPKVFKSVWSGDTETLFQINTSAMRPFVQSIQPNSIEDLSAILALVRPGTMDAKDESTGRTMAEEYVERRKGHSKSSIPQLQKLLPETYGIILYQEQQTKVFRELAGMSAIDSEKLRRALNKKLKAEVLTWKATFMAGARNSVSALVAEDIWNQIEAGSRYSFNKAHSTSYAFITYACMFLRHYYPLEWWASVLTNATENEISQKFHPIVKGFLDAPDINLSTDVMEIDYSRNRIVSKLSVLRGLGDAFVGPIVQNRPYLDIEDFVRKRVLGDSITKKLIYAGVMDSLFPPNTSFLNKMQMYVDAVEKVKYDEKIAEGKNPKPPKKGTIDLEYLNIHPINAVKRKKDILPTMPIPITNIFLECNQKRKTGRASAVFMNVGSDERPEYMFSQKGFSTQKCRLVSGSYLQKIDADENEIYFDFKPELTYTICAIGYVLKAEEKTYQKGLKKRLILNIDFDGYVTEKILWPDYHDGVLSYPDGLKKGSIAMFFLKKTPIKPKDKIVPTGLLGMELIEYT